MWTDHSSSWCFGFLLFQIRFLTNELHLLTICWEEETKQQLLNISETLSSSLVDPGFWPNRAQLQSSFLICNLTSNIAILPSSGEKCPLQHFGSVLAFNRDIKQQGCRSEKHVDGEQSINKTILFENVCLCRQMIF